MQLMYALLGNFQGFSQIHSFPPLSVHDRQDEVRCISMGAIVRLRERGQVVNYVERDFTIRILRRLVESCQQNVRLKRSLSQRSSQLEHRVNWMQRMTNRYLISNIVSCSVCGQL